ncbi:MAG: hypothetical protein Q4D65_09485 [Peptostreptococcaceae bacterium]|nr:hypothetical protein [Peptostreptococcaceae bacterium]
MRFYIRSRKCYWPDHVGKLIGDFLFVLLIFIIAEQNDGKMSYDNVLRLWQWHILSTAMRYAALEMEKEIRLNYLQNLLAQKLSLWKIYAYRGLGCIVESSLIFLAYFLICIQVFGVSIQNDAIPTSNLLSYLLCSFVFMYCFFYLTICLTLRYKRVEVFISMVSTALIFLSGMVFGYGDKSYLLTGQIAKLVYDFHIRELQIIGVQLLVLIGITVFLCKKMNFILHRAN